MMCFYIYVLVCFTHGNSYSGNILKFLNCYPVIYIFVHVIYHTWCFHSFIYSIFSSSSNKYSVMFLYNQQIWCSYVSEIASQVISLLKWLIWPHINMFLLFLVVEMGFKCYSMLFHHIYIPIIPKYKMTYTQKIIMNTQLPLEVSYLYWYENTLYIWYFCEWVTAWLIWHFDFCIVFSHITWFDIHHIVCVSHVTYISADISGVQTITSINANRYMWNVQICTILEGFSCPILVERVLQKSPQKVGEFHLYSCSHLMYFDVPPIVWVWDIITISGDFSDSQIITSKHIYCTA